MSSYRWIGTDGDWNNIANWVTVDGAQSAPSTTLPGPDDETDFSDGTFSLSGAASIGGLRLSGSSLTFDGYFSGNGASTEVTDGGIQGLGSVLSIAPFAYVDVGGCSLTFSALNVDGVFSDAGGDFSLVSLIGPEATWTNTEAASVTKLSAYQGASIFGDLVLGNNGLILADTSTSFSSGTVLCSGANAIKFTDGSDMSSNGAQFSDSLDIDASGRLVMQNTATQAITLDGECSGGGALVLNGTFYAGVSATLDVDIEIGSGSLTVLAGAVIRDNASFTLSDGTLQIFTDDAGADRVSCTAGNNSVSIEHSDCQVQVSHLAQLSFFGGTGSSDIRGGKLLSATLGSGSSSIVLDQGEHLEVFSDSGTAIVTEAQNSAISFRGRAKFVLSTGASGADGPPRADSLTVLEGASVSGTLSLGNDALVLIDQVSDLSATLLINGPTTISARSADGGRGRELVLQSTILLDASGSPLNFTATAGLSFRETGEIHGSGYIHFSDGSFSLDGDNDFSGGILAEEAQLSLATPGAAGSGMIYLSDSGLTIGSAQAAAVPTIVIALGASDTINASCGGLMVYGQSTDSLSFVGGLLPSTVVGGAGKLIALGGSGGDVIFGGYSGKDTLQGGLGASTLIAGINGGLCQTAGTKTQVFVGQGGPTIFDGSGCSGTQAYFNSNSGNSTDILGSGLNLVVTGSGTSTIQGGLGEADIFAGSGALEFQVENGLSEIIQVLGFQPGMTSFTLEGYSVSEAAEAIAGVYTWGGSEFFQLSDQSIIALWGYDGDTHVVFGNGS